jgi:hypothetical protein
MQDELRYFQQGRGVGAPIVPKVLHDSVIDGLFPHVANTGIRQPNQRVPPIHDLKQRLKAVQPNVSAPEMN